GERLPSHAPRPFVACSRIQLERAESGWMELETRTRTEAERKQHGLARLGALKSGRHSQKDHCLVVAALETRCARVKIQIALWSEWEEPGAPRGAHSVCVRAVIRSIRVLMCSSRPRRDWPTSRPELDHGRWTMDHGPWT